VYAYTQNPLRTFPRNLPVDGEDANLLQTCYGLVSDTANKSAKSRCNGIWETTRHNSTTPTYYGLATYTGESGIMDFGL